MPILDFRQLFGQPAPQPHGGELRGKFDDQYGIGKTPEQLRPVHAPGDEQERQTRGKAQHETRDIGPPALGKRCDVTLVARAMAVHRCPPDLPV